MGRSSEEARRLERARHYFLALARRAEANPGDAELLSSMLGERVAQLWEPAIEAAMMAAERMDVARVDPLIDSTIAKSLRDKPDLKLVAELYNRLPMDTVQLKKTSVEVFRQTVLGMEERGGVELHPLGYLAILRNYVMRLLQYGALDEAEREARKALALARERHSDQPAVFANALVENLESWAVVSSRLGRLDVCKEAREEAIGLLRKQTSEDANNRMLAQCLSNHSGTLSSLGDKSGALRHSEEAVQIYRSLVKERAASKETDFGRGLQAWVDDLRPALGDALIALASHQNDAKQPDACLVSAAEACQIFDELNEEFPDQFRGHFAMAKHNLGMAKFAVGDLEAALAEFQEATRVFGVLSDMHPRVWMAEHAQVLGSLAVAYAKADRRNEALETAKQCVALYRTLERPRSGQFFRPLAKCLSLLRGLYEERGQADHAKLTADELARLLEQQREDDPGLIVDIQPMLGEA